MMTMMTMMIMFDDLAPAPPCCSGCVGVLTPAGRVLRRACSGAGVGGVLFLIAFRLLALLFAGAHDPALSSYDFFSGDGGCRGDGGGLGARCGEAGAVFGACFGGGWVGTSFTVLLPIRGGGDAAGLNSNGVCGCGT